MQDVCVHAIHTSNDEFDNDLDQLVDENDQSELIPSTTFYSVYDTELITVQFELQSYDTTFYNLNKENIISDSFTLNNEYGFEISSDKYDMNFDKGEINLDEDVLPGVFEASFYYYPIYKSPYIQGAQWDATDLNEYDGNTLWIEEVQDAEVFDGIMLNFQNDWDVAYQNCNWVLDGIESSDNLNTLDVAVDTLSFPGYTAYASPNDYMIVFSDDANFNQDLIGTSTNFKVYDRTNDLELDYQFLGSQSNNEIDHLDRIYLFEDYPNNDNMYTWNIEFTYFPSQQESQPTIVFGQDDTLFINVSKPFIYGDEFSLSTTMPDIDENVSSSELSNIRVVPNPYIAATIAESSLPPGVSSGRGERKIEFQNVPNDATIKIYNIRGQHITTLNHDGNIFDGSVSWDLRTKENMDIAYGVYLYVVESSMGVKKGKIAIIK